MGGVAASGLEGCAVEETAHLGAALGPASDSQRGSVGDYRAAITPDCRSSDRTVAQRGDLSGLAAGLLGMLCTIMRPMLQAMDGRDFRNFMEAFLRCADHGLGKAYNLAWAIVPVFGPIVAPVLVWDDPGSTSFILTAIGLGIVLVGIWLVSNVWKTPTYNLILAWDPGAMPADWEAGRRRYFTINWIQMAVTWSAFALFLFAVISL